jgi:hypothetical protein
MGIMSLWPHFWHGTVDNGGSSLGINAFVPQPLQAIMRSWLMWENSSTSPPADKTATAARMQKEISSAPTFA